MKKFKVFITIAFILLVIFSLMYMAADHYGYTDKEFVASQIKALHESKSGALVAGGVIILLLLIDLLLPVPSSVVMTISGTIFGTFSGGLISFAGAIMAAITGYWLCRWFGKPAFERMTGKENTKAVEEWFEEWGIIAIIISRPIPMLTEILSCLAGMSGTPFALFLAASTFGTLPICFVYAYAGQNSSVTNPWPAVWVAILLPAIGWLITRFVKKRAKD